MYKKTHSVHRKKGLKLKSEMKTKTDAKTEKSDNFVKQKSVMCVV